MGPGVTDLGGETNDISEVSNLKKSKLNDELNLISGKLEEVEKLTWKTNMKPKIKKI